MGGIVAQGHHPVERLLLYRLLQGLNEPVIRWKDIFAVLEKAIDSTETAAHTLEGVAIKNG